MKDSTYEDKRHKLVLERISNAKNIKELPNITLASLSKFLADNVYFDKRHIPAKEFKPFILKMIDNGMISNAQAEDCFIDILYKNYPNHTEKEFEDMYKKIIGTGRINNMFIEMSLRGEKIKDIQDEIDLENHKKNMDDIKHAITISDLDNIPRIELIDLLRKDVKNEIIEDIPDSKLSNLICVLYNKKDYQEVDMEIENICKSYKLSNEDFYIMYNQIFSGIIFDKKINYVIEEDKLREKQTRSIYKNEHLLTLEKINEAMDLSQLPKGIDASKLSRYLSINAKLEDKKIAAKEFNNLVEILLSGKSLNSKTVKDELRKIIVRNNIKSPRKSFDKLLENFNSLYRINYFVEEINLCRKRKQEFTENDFINIDLYFVPTPNSPEHGGVHYTLFKNEVSNLDINALVPSYSSLDELEEKVKAISPSFKKIGGIILRPNERINLPEGGNIKFYREKVGESSISTKENSRLAKIEELTVKQNRLLELQAQEREQFDEKQKITASQLKEIQQELLKLTSDSEIDYDNEKKKGLKNES